MKTVKLPIVAIVGRANVGKSSLFNTILKRREAIVAREAGTTRDTIGAKAEWKGKQFWLVDTAGYKDPADEFEETIQDQIEEAATNADVIWVVIEANILITDEDRRVAKLALKSGKPVILVVNKIDKVKHAVAEDYQKLGIKPILLISVTQKQGIDKLLDVFIEQIPKAKLKDVPDKLHVALLGRPNVGKSYLFNTLAKKQQALVSERAGTTRDINRVTVKFKGREIELLDTAGIRRSGKIGVGIERFSVLRTLSAIEQADVCLLLMDANELNVAVDQKIAGMIKDAGKGLILVVSKWDPEGRPKASYDANNAELFNRFSAQIKHSFAFVPWAPLVFTSAVTGQNVTRLLELALEIDQRRKQKIKTSQLNRWLQTAIAKHPPASSTKNLHPRLNYIVQETDNPTPAFKIYGAHTRFLHWSYKRYIERDFREHYDFVGTPVQFWFFDKHTPHKHSDRSQVTKHKNQENLDT